MVLTAASLVVSVVHAPSFFLQPWTGFSTVPVTDPDSCGSLAGLGTAAPEAPVAHSTVPSWTLAPPQEKTLSSEVAYLKCCRLYNQMDVKQSKYPGNNLRSTKHQQHLVHLMFSAPFQIIWGISSRAPLYSCCTPPLMTKLWSLRCADLEVLSTLRLLDCNCYNWLTFTFFKCLD